SSRAPLASLPADGAGRVFRRRGRRTTGDERDDRIHLQVQGAEVGPRGNPQARTDQAMKSCPSREELRRLLAEELTEPEFAAMQRHVDGCPSCQDSLETLTGAPAELAALRRNPASPRNLVSGAGKSANSGDSALAPRQDFLKRLMAHGPSAEALDPEPAEPARGRVENTDWPTIPGYEILGVLGRGGMGVVYEAKQVSLNRRVALKVLTGGMGLTPKGVQRFRREAETAAKLHHTNIVPV